MPPVLLGRPSVSDGGLGGGTRIVTVIEALIGGVPLSWTVITTVLVMGNGRTGARHLRVPDVASK
jgi:hypothetical protein